MQPSIEGITQRRSIPGEITKEAEVGATNKALPAAITTMKEVAAIPSIPEGTTIMAEKLINNTLTTIINHNPSNLMKILATTITTISRTMRNHKPMEGIVRSLTTMQTICILSSSIEHTEGTTTMPEGTLEAAATAIMVTTITEDPKTTSEDHSE